MKERIYFDNNATTKIAQPALEAVVSVYQESFNPSAIHYLGRDANKLINQSREHIKDLLNGNDYQVIFTSGGTESNNLAVLGLADYQIITSKIEHSSIYDAVDKNNSPLIKVNKDGIVDINSLEEILSKLSTKNFLVSVMLVNNETGAIQPLKAIAQLVHSYGGLIHSDMVQGVGKIEIDLSDLDIDMASVSAHKFNGPQGVGALLAKDHIQISRIIHGGSQEHGKRPGTQNVAGIVGFGEACKIAVDNIRSYNRIENLRNYLEESLKDIAKSDLIIFSDQVKRIPNTSFVAVKGIDNQTQLINFDLNNIAVSVGSACSSGSSKPSRVLQAMGFDDNISKYVIRISLGLANTKEEIDKFIIIWSDLYNRHIP